MYAVRERECTGCGTKIRGRYPAHGDVHCIDCAIAKAKQCAIEMANKSGPAYDRWLATRGPQGRPRHD